MTRISAAVASSLILRNMQRGESRSVGIEEVFVRRESLTLYAVRRVIVGSDGLSSCRPLC